MVTFTNILLITLIASSLIISVYAYIQWRTTQIRQNQTPDLTETITGLIENKLDDGTIDRRVEQQFDELVDRTINDLFGRYGDVSAAIQTKLKEIMIPAVEAHDFSKHTIGLESLLDGLIQNLTHRQDDMLEKVQALYGLESIKEITMSDLFIKYQDMIAEEVDTSSLDVITEDDVYYDNISATMAETSSEETHMREIKTIAFACREDDSLAVRVELSRWTESQALGNDWRISGVYHDIDGDTPRRLSLKDYDLSTLDLPIKNLRELNAFEIFLIKLSQERTIIVLDTTDDEYDEIDVKAEPDVTYI